MKTNSPSKKRVPNKSSSKWCPYHKTTSHDKEKCHKPNNQVTEPEKKDKKVPNKNYIIKENQLCMSNLQFHGSVDDATI